jgi:hypothetical protein
MEINSLKLERAKLLAEIEDSGDEPLDLISRLGNLTFRIYQLEKASNRKLKNLTDED